MQPIPRKPSTVERRFTDKNLLKDLLEWAEKATGTKRSNGSFAEALKSGEILCKLANVVEPDVVKKMSTRQNNLGAAENIGQYLRACWILGLPAEFLFNIPDLTACKGLDKVARNLFELSRLAQSKITWSGPVLPHTAPHGEKKTKPDRPPRPGMPEIQIKNRLRDLELQFKQKDALPSDTLENIKIEMKNRRSTLRDIDMLRRAVANNKSLNANASSTGVRMSLEDGNYVGLCELINSVFDKNEEEKTMEDFRNYTDILRHEVNRRYFSNQLYGHLKRVVMVQLPDTHFQGILLLMTTALEEMKMGGSNDFMLGRRFMWCAGRLSHRDVNGSIEPLQKYLTGHSIFGLTSFWYDSFLDEFNKKYSRFFPGLDTAPDLQFVATLCGTYVMNMRDWAVPESIITDFVKEIITNNEIGMNEPQQLEEAISSVWRRNNNSSPPSHHRTTSKVRGSYRESKMFSEPKFMNRDEAARRIFIEKLIPLGPIVLAGNLLVKFGIAWKIRPVLIKKNFLIVLDALPIRATSRSRMSIPLFYARIAQSEKRSYSLVVGESIISQSDVFLSFSSEAERARWQAAIAACTVKSSQCSEIVEDRNTAMVALLSTLPSQPPTPPPASKETITKSIPNSGTWSFFFDSMIGQVANSSSNFFQTISQNLPTSSSSGRSGRGQDRSDSIVRRHASTEHQPSSSSAEYTSTKFRLPARTDAKPLSQSSPGVGKQTLGETPSKSKFSLSSFGRRNTEVKEASTSLPDRQ